MPDGGSILIQRSPDFERIAALPRRRFTWEQAERDAAELTPELVTPLGKKAGVALRPLQGFVLQEWWKQLRSSKTVKRGVYASLSVGAGKTLISRVAGYVAGAKRPILVLPENLIDKTIAEFEEYDKYWLPETGAAKKPPRLVGYRELTRDYEHDLLQRLQPDCIIFDEVDILANQDGSATKAFDRYIADTGVPVLAMTGTDGRFSIKDFSHFLVWTLKDYAPVPLDFEELERWAAALDERRPGMRGMLETLLPGALLDLVPEDAEACLRAADWAEKDIAEILPTLRRLDVARIKFQRRMAETPGVIMLDDDDCDQPLTIRHVCAPESLELNAHFETFRLEERTPAYIDPTTSEPIDGIEVSDPLSKMRLDGELGCDFHNIWSPLPPREWREGYRAFARFVRRWIERSNTMGRPRGVRGAWPLDTEKAVKNAFPDAEAVVAWRALEPTFKPNSVPMWLGGSVVGAAAEWAEEAPGLIWIAHTPVGAAIAELTGLPYYGAKGLTASGQNIVHIDPTKSAIVSIGSNLRGRNLQAFNRNLVIGCPQSAKYFEQLVGRTHRYGQTKPVLVEIMLTSGLSVYSFDMLLKEAKFVKAVRGKTQKILRSDIERTTFPSESLRWAHRPAA